MKWFETRMFGSRPENEKPEHGKMNSRFTLIGPIAHAYSAGIQVEIQEKFLKKNSLKIFRTSIPIRVLKMVSKNFKEF